jgi:hypothetical protein
MCRNETLKMNQAGGIVGEMNSGLIQFCFCHVCVHFEMISLGKNTKFESQHYLYTMPPVSCKFGQEVIHSQSKEIISNLYSSVKDEAKTGIQIPIKTPARGAAATGVSKV